MNTKALGNIITFILSLSLIIFLSIEILFNLTPPISRDALIHHLAIPKLWLIHGGFYEIPWANFSYYPMNIDLLYWICLYFKNDIIPKFIHFFFGLGTGWLIFQYLDKKTGRNWGLLGAVIFLSTPIVIWLSTAAYVDLGMTFFTTGSILAFIKWRDSEYVFFRWFVLSAICMGMAIGSKYNALIAFVFINLILVHNYAKDTGKQILSIKYGAIFFIITAIIASPWYLKNYFLTGNPCYPLFGSFFKLFYHQPIQKVLHDQVAQKNNGVGFFRLRQVMYGESFWETLLIPLRMFFQGDDNSYRYFQGVLNPILIVFTPFVVLKNSNRRDPLLFGLFAAFFIIVAFFKTAKQVRYIAPVLPFLAVLAVTGIKNIDTRLKVMKSSFFPGYDNYVKLIVRSALFASIGILLACNMFYLNNRIHLIQPFRYVFKHETRDAFLERNLDYYPAVKYINSHLPANSKIFTMFLGRRGYYLEQNYKNDESFGRNTLYTMVKNSKNVESFNQYICSIGITHIFMRSALVDRYLKNNFSKKENLRFMIFVKKYWKLVYTYNGYSVWDIRI